MVNITAAQQGWDIVCWDISSAFLRGLTFKEMEDKLGGPVREVCFDLPTGTAELLCNIAGFESFNAALECLHMDKGGFGLKDAPRLFGLRRDSILRDHGLKPTHADPQLWELHEGAMLVLMLSTHLDDLKVTGTSSAIAALATALENVFGEMKRQVQNFIHCGINHKQDPNTYEVDADQAQYVAGLNPISEEAIAGKDDSEEVSSWLHQQYQSLLGGIAWCTLTMVHICVYVTALQRAAKKPTVGHLRRLNIVVTYAKANPHGIHSKRLTPPVACVMVGDSAFRREPNDEGLALRGAIILLVEITDQLPGGQCNVLDFYASKHRHVVRSTWDAELRQLTDGIDNLLMLDGLFHETRYGVAGAKMLRDMMEYGRTDEAPAMPLHACLDAYSVFSATSAEVVRMPAERHTLYHVQWVRECIDAKVLTALWWIDTRDCCADGMTKGTVVRDAILQVMRGQWQLEHETRRFPAA